MLKLLQTHIYDSFQDLPELSTAVPLILKQDPKRIWHHQPYVGVCIIKFHVSCVIPLVIASVRV